MRLLWKDIYNEAELYKAAVRVYTKPLFQWRKALNVSADGRTLYDLAAQGLRGLDSIHRALMREEFAFRPSVGYKYNFNGKRRTIYIPPWEERIVDLLLYRVLNQHLHQWFSPHSYAYRDRSYGLDSCQSRIRSLLRSSRGPLYLTKRDISDYFASIVHPILLQQLAEHVEPDDYLFRLIEQRVRFVYQDETGTHRAAIGVPFGCASACVFANIYLTGLDYAAATIPGLHYFRYADDILMLSRRRESALSARELVAQALSSLQLITKSSHELDLLLSAGPSSDEVFAAATSLR